MNSWLMRSIGGEGQGGRGVNGRGMEKPRGRGEMGSMCIIHLGALRVPVWLAGVGAVRREAGARRDAIPRAEAERHHAGVDDGVPKLGHPERVRC